MLDLIGVLGRHTSSFSKDAVLLPTVACQKMSTVTDTKLAGFGRFCIYRNASLLKSADSNMANRNHNLLIVDDEPSVALTLKMIFEREGYAVATAASCAEALRTLNTGRHFDAPMYSNLNFNPRRAELLPAERHE